MTRVTDVKSVSASGACSDAVVANDDGTWSARINDKGECHIVVSFNSGGQFTDDVALACAPGACCASCGPSPDREVRVPELDGG
jgi:hypothetical protein